MVETKFIFKTLKPGFLIKDIKTGGLGILINKTNLFKNLPDREPIWVWEIYWAGSITKYQNQNTFFVERVVFGFILGGAWVVFRGDVG